MARDEFDPEQYTCLEEIGSFPSGKKQSIAVALWQYQDGPVKVKVQRTGQRADGAYRRDAGGLSLSELTQVLPLLHEAEKALQRLGK